MNERAGPSDLAYTIEKYSTLISVLIAISVVIGSILIYLAVSLSSNFAWGLFLLMPSLAAAYYFSCQRRKLRQLQQLRRDWSVIQLTKERDFKTIRPLFDHSAASEKAKYWVDDQTWKDLNMDQVYTRVDRTLTDPGESVLYQMLREPLSSKEELVERGQAIRSFQNHVQSREKVQRALLSLGHQFAHNDLFTLLWRDEFPHSRLSPLFLAMAVCALASLLIPLVFWSALLILVPVGVFIINLLIHYYIKRKKDLETISFPYLIRCIKTARNLSSLKDESLSPYSTHLGELYRSARGILRRARFLFPADQTLADPASGFIQEYFNIFFLLEINAFYATAGELNRHKQELRELYLALGKLDAFQSIASYRSSLTGYAEPEFVEGVHLEIKDARQPLLDNPVPASISFDKNVVIITGSNMGGKSTFLRNIGNNVLLVQTIATSLSSSYRGSLFKLVSSISRTDDLIAGKSFYYVEAERILRIIQNLDGVTPTLCIIDELLSGTNSFERLRASEGIIHYLTHQNVLAIVATHDLELAGKLNGRCDFFHFTDDVNANGLTFDYKLKPGIANTRNAIALLRQLGYPQEIIDRANQA